VVRWFGCGYAAPCLSWLGFDVLLLRDLQMDSPAAAEPATQRTAVTVTNGTFDPAGPLSGLPDDCREALASPGEGASLRQCQSLLGFSGDCFSVLEGRNRQSVSLRAAAMRNFSGQGSRARSFCHAA
jgi:hypothetical protein